MGLFISSMAQDVKPEKEEVPAKKSKVHQSYISGFQPDQYEYG
jgi:hypothetical protein